MRYCIYCRVSTEEQAKTGYSLQAQEKICKNFVESEGGVVEKVFIERGESASTANRTRLKEMLNYLRQNKGVDFVVVWKLDRFARNLLDQLSIMNQLASDKVRVLSATENNDDTPVGRLMRNVMGAFNQYDNEERIDKIITGMRQAILEGRYVFAAPFGYSYGKDDKGRKVLQPNENAYFVQKLFEMVDEGNLSRKEICRRVSKMGCRMYNRKLYDIIKNPVYIGKIKIKWFNELIEGIHEPIVEKDLFWRVNNRKKHVDKAKPKVLNEQFVLNGFVRCECGKKVTGYFAKGRSNRYGYYKCSSSCNNTKKSKFENDFVDFLKGFELDSDYTELFGEILQRMYKKRSAEQELQYKLKEQRHKQLVAKKKRANNLLLEGAIDAETYKEMTTDLNTDLLTSQVEMNETRTDFEDVATIVKWNKIFVSNLSEVWLKASYERRLELQRLLFPDGLVYIKNKGFRTASKSPIIKALSGVKGGVSPEWWSCRTANRTAIDFHKSAEITETICKAA